MDKRDKLIVALDVNTIQQALYITYQLRNLTNFYKVGWQLFMSEGMNAVRALSREGHNVFLDLKLYDIPHTIRRTAFNIPCIQNVQFLSIAGSPTVYKAAQEGLDLIEYGKLSACNADLLYVTQLSSSTTGTLSPADLKQNNVRGIVASGNLVSWYRRAFTHDQMTIVVPGIRLTQQEANDHHHVNTVETAFERGADYIVVGRPILNASDPTKATKEIIQRIP